MKKNKLKCLETIVNYYYLPSNLWGWTWFGFDCRLHYLWTERHDSRHSGHPQISYCHLPHCVFALPVCPSTIEWREREKPRQADTYKHTRFLLFQLYVRDEFICFFWCFMCMSNFNPSIESKVSSKKRESSDSRNHSNNNHRFITTHTAHESTAFEPFQSR